MNIFVGYKMCVYCDACARLKHKRIHGTTAQTNYTSSLKHLSGGPTRTSEGEKSIRESAVDS